MKPEAPTIYRFSCFQFDPRERILLRDGEVVPLEHKTAQVLHLLLQRPGRVVEKQEMSARIWPETFVEERNIAQHVYTLRKVLGGAKGGRQYIETAQRSGYRFVAAVSEVVRESDQAERATGQPGCGLNLCPTNLPLQPNAMIGREGDLRNVMSMVLLDDVRLVTLTGAPGSGKTRLGIGTAAELKRGFPDGVFLVELAAIRDPELFASAIAGTLGLKETGNTPPTDALKQHLNGRRVLLLLDNFEHLLPAASLLADLLASAGDFKVLATSRAALDIRWEHQYPVEPLAVPEVAQTVSLRRYQPKADRAQAKAYATLEDMRECASVALFLERARAVKPGFDLNAQNAHEVAGICRRLDGLPLAIELVAGYVNTFSPRTILRRLEQDAGLPAGARQDAPSRHQTMQRAIEWSYDLLRTEERILFTRLSVFVGGFTLDAAEAVCAGEEVSRSNLAATLRDLVNKSIVRRDSKDEARFAMLEVIREYGLERLAATGETETLGRRHADFFCRLAERNERPRENGETLWSTLGILGVEIGNLRAAMGWCRASRELEMQLRTASALRSYWKTRGQHEEGRIWLEPALSARALVSPLTGLRALAASGFLARLRGDYADAVSRTEEALTLSRELGDPEAIAESLMLLGNTWTSAGFPDQGVRLLEESLAIRRDRGDTWRVACLLNDIATVYYVKGNYDQSFVLQEESLSLFRSLGDKWGAASCLNNLGRLLALRGKYGEAYSYMQECLLLVRVASDDFRIYQCLESLAELACAEGADKRALRLLAAVDKWHKATNTSVSPTLDSDFETILATARVKVDEKTFETLWEEGRTMTRDEAIRFALEAERLISAIDSAEADSVRNLAH